MLLKILVNICSGTGLLQQDNVNHINQCWLNVSWALGNKLTSKLNEYRKISFQELAFQISIVCKMPTILFRPWLICFFFLQMWTPPSNKRPRLLPSPEPSPEGPYVGQHSQGIGGHYAETHIKKHRFWDKGSYGNSPGNGLNYWGRVTHLCVSKPTSIASDNGLSPGRRQAIIWTNARILLIGPLGTIFNEILSEIHTFSFNKMRLKMSSGKWRSFCLGLNVLN